MSILKLGKVRPTPKGAWTASSVYEAMDWVTHKGLAYQALINVPATKEPDTSPTYWMQTGMKGEKGDKGDPGIQGAAGTNGRDGRDGTPGAAGQTGAQGAQGAQGPKGDQGPMGPQGAQGAQGPQGTTPQLSDAVNSTLGTVAASSKAVKTAYDKAALACIPLTNLLTASTPPAAAAPCPIQPMLDTDIRLGVVHQYTSMNGCLPAGGSWHYIALSLIRISVVGNGYGITALSAGVAAGGTKVIDVPAGEQAWVSGWRVA